ncbi:MAG: hypothetical protein P8174_07170 [Gemmatimonadota bacterium]
MKAKEIRTVMLAVPALAGLGFAVLDLAGCGRGAQPVAVLADTLRGPETVVSAASGLIGGLADMQLGSDGTLYMLDMDNARVIARRPDGGTVTIGRDGSGPGEFQRPVSLAVSDDTVWVHDIGTGRLQAFSTSGAYLAGHRIPTDGMGGGSALLPDGTIAVATGGADSTLVEVFAPAGRRIAGFGHPLAPPNMIWDFTAMKTEIREGHVPDQFRNLTMPFWGPDRTLWLVLVAEGEVRRYTETGQLKWKRTLEDATLDTIRSTFFTAGRTEKNPAFLPMLRIARDAQATSRGLWLLLDTPHDLGYSVLLLLDPKTGAVRRRVVVEGVPDAGQIAVDPDRLQLYLSRTEQASVVRFPFTEAAGT